tara:strand:- start:164 stop:583 length:420 start_codon:yes stop_codon:yes gene_type:complete
MFRLSSKSKANRRGVDPRLIEIDDLAITLTLVDYGHGRYAGKRTPELQCELFNDGKSRCDGTDRLSKHQSGKALDFYAYVDGRASWQHEHLAMVACAYLQAASMLGYKLKWGGLWKSRNPTIKNGIAYGWDCPHVELID